MVGAASAQRALRSGAPRQTVNSPGRQATARLETAMEPPGRRVPGALCPPRSPLPGAACWGALKMFPSSRALLEDHSPPSPQTNTSTQAQRSLLGIG